MARSATRRALFGAVALALALTACSDDGDDAGADTAAGGADCPDGRIRFGIEPYEDPSQLTPAYEVLAGALEEQLGCDVELQIVADYAAEVLAMENGELEMAQFGPLGFVFASQRAEAEPLVSFANADGTLSSYTGGIWVPTDSDIQSLEDLEGHSLALSEPGSTSGDALPRYAMREAGLADDAVEITYAGGHPEALLALTNGQIDAAEINSQQQASATAEGQFDASQFRQIWTSDPIPNDPITVAGSLDPELKEAIRQALLHLTPENIAAVGAFLDVDPPGPMVEVTRDTYQPLFDLAQTLGLTEDDV